MPGKSKTWVYKGTSRPSPIPVLVTKIGEGNLMWRDGLTTPVELIDEDVRIQRMNKEYQARIRTKTPKRNFEFAQKNEPMGNENTPSLEALPINDLGQGNKSKPFPSQVLFGNNEDAPQDEDYLFNTAEPPIAEATCYVLWTINPLIENLGKIIEEKKTLLPANINASFFAEKLQEHIKKLESLLTELRKAKEYSTEQEQTEAMSEVLSKWQNHFDDITSDLVPAIPIQNNINS